MSTALLGEPTYRRLRIRDARDSREVPRLVLAAWAALFLNVLAFSALPTLVPVPRPAGQLVTQGALLVAFVLALAANRRGLVRANAMLTLLTVMAVVALMVSVHNTYLAGSTFRAVRLLGFVAVLWLLTPWFGKRGMVLLRCHRMCLWVVLGSVLAGAAVAPGPAFSFGGRLSGVLWPIPPTQVAHYAAVLLGSTAVLWGCRVVSGRNALLTCTVAGGVLIATHTRTALAGTAIGLLVAGVSLFLGHARVRRSSAMAAALGVVGVSVFASQLTAWALRGQTAQEAGDLTGRTKVWTQVFSLHRPPVSDLFGSGMSNMSFNGLPIDSNWVATYLDLGWFGMALDAAVLLVLLLMAVTHTRGAQRGVALFLIVYCLVASFTETGLSNASPYLLDLIVAAAVLSTPSRAARPW